MNPISVGKKVCEQFLRTSPECYAPVGYDGAEPGGGGKFVMYAVSSLWLNALHFARLSGDAELEKRLVDFYWPFLSEKAHLCSRMNHVDFSVFGTVPLEVAVLTGDRRALDSGLRYADHQWEAPDPADAGDTGNAAYEKQMEYLADGFSPQSRFWIEDMYMMTVLQVQAFRATGELKYLSRMARQMSVYLDRMQLPDGMFHHCAEAPFLWGRGNGWVAGGMPLLLEYLPETDPNYGKILESYRLMMSTLLRYQHQSGLWGQIVDGDDAWDESSCSGMFASALVKGVRRGWLDAGTYGPAAEKAWLALCAKLDTYGNLADTGAGINSSSNRQVYLDCPKVNGAPHGQAALLWTVNALLA